MERRLPPVSAIPIDLAALHATVGAGARTVLEVGAHHGTHTATFLEAFPQAHVHAFEPDPRAADRFRAGVADRRVTLHEMAIGAANGRAEFHVSSGMPPGATKDVESRYRKGWDQSGSLRAPKRHLERHPWCRFVRTISVEVRTLDAWSRKHAPGTVDFIWADVQGAEGDLVRGGAETLARTRWFYCEYSADELYEGEPTLAALLDMLPGFEVERLYPSDVLLRNVALTNRPRAR
jgi:FkbM family methyltransferase